METKRYFVLTALLLLLFGSFFLSCKRAKPIESQIYRLTDHITEKDIRRSPLKNIIRKFNRIDQDLTGQWKHFPSLSDDTHDVWAISSKFPILSKSEGKQPEGMKIFKDKEVIPFFPRGGAEGEYWSWLQTKQKRIQVHKLKGYKRRVGGIEIREGKSAEFDVILPHGPVNFFFRITKVNCKDYTPNFIVTMDGEHVRGFSLEAPDRPRVWKKRVKLGNHRIAIKFLPPDDPRLASTDNYILLKSIEVRAKNDLILLSTPISEDKIPPEEKFKARYYSVFSESTQKPDPEAEKALVFYDLKESDTINNLGINNNPYSIVRKAHLYNDTLNCLYAAPESSFRFDIIPTGAYTFEFGYGFIRDNSFDSMQPVRFKVNVEHKGKTVAQFSVDFQAIPNSKFETEKIDLGPFQGKKVKIHMQTEEVGPEMSSNAGDMNPHAIWINPVLYRKAVKEKANVILVSIDTLRADHLGCYGYNRSTSPEIDLLAKDSVLFEKSISTTSWTLPAHVSLLTSLNNSKHKVINYLSRISPEHITLAEILRNNDLYCAAITGGGYLSFKYGFDKGFEMFHEIRHGGERSVRFDEAEYISQKSLEWLEQYHDRNFFLFIHTYQPHNPYKTTSDIGKIFLSQDAKWDGLWIDEILKARGRFITRFTEKERQNIVDLYDGEIRYTDEALIKPLVDFLKKSDLYDNTMIIVTSDHGEEFLEHGNWLHGISLYNEVIQVPLIVKFPQSQHKGIRIPYICSINDIMPTVIETIGLDPSLFKLDGKTLLPLVEGLEKEDRTFFSDLTIRKLKKFSPSIYATNDGSMKLIQNKDVRSPYIKKTAKDFYGEKIELYDLQSDFLEKNNLAGNSDFENLCKKLLDQIVLYTALEDEASTLEMDEELKENLRALGYIK
jgi:arylsulfatase A-like enzyme